MKFTQDTLSNNSVRKLVRGEITVGNDVFKENLVLHNDRVEARWNAVDMASLAYADLAAHLRPDTEIVLLGTGWNNRVPPRDLMFALARRGIGFEFMDTPAACRTFNILLGEDREVTAFLVIQ